MELVETTIRAKSVRETWELHQLTDTHIDDPDHADKELRERIAHIAENPRALWIGGGDYGSLILPNDPRFSTPSSDPVHRLPDVYLERCEELFAPIREKCVGLATGNHEDTIGKHYHRGVGAELAMRLGRPEMYIGTRGWAILKFKLGTRHLTIRAFQYHGWSSGRLKGRKAIQAERDIGAWRADALFLGHDHQPYADIFWAQEPYDTKNGYKLRTKPVAVINGGAWTYGQRAPTSAATKLARSASDWPNESWAETKNFRPQPPECPILEIHLDFGAGRDKHHLGRPSGFEFEIRRRAGTYES